MQASASGARDGGRVLPWINESIERLNCDILQVLQVLLMEYSLNTKEWQYLVPIVQGNLNHAPVESLGSKSPCQLFNALNRPTPFKVIVLQRDGSTIVVEAQRRPSSDEHYEALRTSLKAMHRHVAEQRERRRQQNMQRHRGQQCEFSVGDFDLWARVDARLSHDKLLARWVGPFEVTEALTHSFVVRNIINGQQVEVHGSRLKFFCESELDVNDELRAHVGNQGLVLGVEAILEHRKTRAGWQLLVSWRGLQNEEDSWKPLVSLAQDVQTKV